MSLFTPLLNGTVGGEWNRVIDGSIFVFATYTVRCFFSPNLSVIRHVRRLGEITSILYE